MSAVAKGELQNDMRFIFHNMLSDKPLQPFHKFFFRQLGIFDRVVVPKHPMRCYQLCIPEPSIHFHRYWSRNVVEVYNKLSEKIETTKYVDRLYLSRRRTSKRRLRNDLDCENVFRDFGVQIVHPELLDIKEKISLFKNAKWVTGPIGSASHNILFLSGETKLIALHGDEINSNYLAVDFLRGVPSIYIRRSSLDGDSFTINVDQLRIYLKINL